MTLSVIVPAYNMASGARLSFCLDSLIRQTMDAALYEIIVCDDASTDGTKDVMADYEKRYPGRIIALYNEVNLHQGGAKNRALKRAQGDWIAFVDADDWVAKDFLETLFTAAKEADADMAGCDYFLAHTQSFEGSVPVKSHSEDLSGEMTGEKKKALLLDNGFLVTKIYKRSVIFGDADSLGSVPDVFPEHMFYEDNAVGTAWMMRVRRYAYVQKPLYYYYQHETSTVHTVSRTRLFDRMRAGRMMLDQARADGALTQYPEEIIYKFTRLFYINTLFSAMQAHPAPEGCYELTKALGKEMAQTFPDFMQNPYFASEVQEEEKKLIAMQMRSHAAFYIYYRLLWFYRDHLLRKKRSPAEDAT